ncbi:MAG: hypothetical protein Q4G64_03090, partial [bacterium]|nr:hypothetical protein [bacterium]
VAETAESQTTTSPTTAAPTTEAHTTEAPTTEEPTTYPPNTEAPTTEAPTTEPPSEPAGEPFEPELDFSGTPEGYTRVDEPPAEGFYTDFVSETCNFEHRFTMVDLWGSDAPVSDDLASLQALTSLYELYTDWTPQDGPVPFEQYEKVSLPGKEQDYEFLVSDIESLQGTPMRLATSYTPIPAGESLWEIWGVDYLMTCASGADMDAEWEKVTAVTQPHLYKNTDIPEEAAQGSN